MFSLESVLSLFSLLIIASLAFFASKRFKVPYTVLLVIIGLVIAVIAHNPYFEPVLGYLTSFKLTPDLLFFLFLPILLFESAFNMSVRKLVENVRSISLLAVVGMLLSTAVITAGMYFILPLIGLDVPLIVILLFASIISSTDPVAVLALFKEYKAPKRLSMIFEGESLFNDATAVALFMVVLAVAQQGFSGTETIIDGTLTFISMLGIGSILGIFFGVVFGKLLNFAKSNEFVAITLLLTSAHVVFVLSEMINHYGFFGVDIHVSPIIATTFAALFLGNYSKHVLSPESDEYLEKSIAHLAFVVNSLVFILIGILFATTDVPYVELILAIAVAIVVVATARAISIYATIPFLNMVKVEEHIPMSWQHLLSWGSLRGALAIITILLIPDDIVIQGWTMEYPVKDFLIALTAGCILFTLLIKANMMKAVMNALHVYDHDEFEEIRELFREKFDILNEKARFSDHYNKGYLLGAESGASQIGQRIDAELDEVNEKISKLDIIKVEQALYLAAISIEEKYIKELYVNGEVSHPVYTRIMGKLTLQKERIACAEGHLIDASKTTDGKDIFNLLMESTKYVVKGKTRGLTVDEKLEYYRAQTVISRKVVKNLQEINIKNGEELFPKIALDNIVAIYKTYRDQSKQKLESIIFENKDESEKRITELDELTLISSKKKGDRFLEDRGFLVHQNH